MSEQKVKLEEPGERWMRAAAIVDSIVQAGCDCIRLDDGIVLKRCKRCAMETDTLTVFLCGENELGRRKGRKESIEILEAAVERLIEESEEVLECDCREAPFSESEPSVCARHEAIEALKLLKKGEKT